MTKNRSMDTKLCAALAAAVLLLAGCATSKNHAPVEDRSNGSRTAAVVPPASAASSPEAPKEAPKPGAENAGKAGYYTVKPGDTMIRIGLENGQNWKDIAKWNGIENPNLIEVGQVLRVIPPGVDPNGANGNKTAKVEVKPLGSAQPNASPASGAASGVAPTPAASSPVPPSPKEGDDDINWLWPATGPVAGVFDESKSKGLAITGKAGDPVFAAADGRVVYAGSGLRGYGNLVILKHNNTYLTAYAHNQTLLVKEDQTVRRGQKIAEMGSTDAERVQLHFEIRKLGKPIDPAKLLPPR
ncbi:peptidoglycan DD-metalloendopeptidase family protein [Piscinibacter terrae]|uniref:LysM peptidoglycan-binding domain-containing protein n=1 Tax=Piscinibacter terrae TaxID=2496871 RepID=A0A3N7JLW4_9BURK|nr:LysM peptidoglycan-binding domain-containing protein [Albitalea terrae]